MSSLQNLFDQRQLWRAREASDDSAYALSSEWPRLDRELYGAGWPTASISELLCVEPVLAWRLLQPALVRLSQQQRLLIWIGHSSAPYAPAWLRAGLTLGRCLLVRASDDEALWAAEQALRLAQGGAVILQAKQIAADRLRRLQLAAQTGNSFAFLLRPLSAQRYSTPAALRMSVLPAVEGLQITLHKRRGGAASAPFVVPLASTAPRIASDRQLPMREASVRRLSNDPPAIAGREQKSSRERENSSERESGREQENSCEQEDRHEQSSQEWHSNHGQKSRSSKPAIEPAYQPFVSRNAAPAVVGDLFMQQADGSTAGTKGSGAAESVERNAVRRKPVLEKQASVTLPPRMAAFFLTGTQMKFPNVDSDNAVELMQSEISDAVGSDISAADKSTAVTASSSSSLTHR